MVGQLRARCALALFQTVARSTGAHDSEIVGGVNSAKGPDSSVGGLPVCNCVDVDHMEEEVQDRVQVEVEREEQKKGETHGKEEGEEQRENRRLINRSIMDCDTHHETRAMCRRKMTCEVYPMYRNRTSHESRSCDRGPSVAVCFPSNCFSQMFLEFSNLSPCCHGVAKSSPCLSTLMSLTVHAYTTAD